jgi:hypothetical protein
MPAVDHLPAVDGTPTFDDTPTVDDMQTLYGPPAHERIAAFDPSAAGGLS